MPAEPQPDDDTAGLADGLRELSDVWRVGLDGAQVMAQRVLDLYTNLPATARMTPGTPDADLRRVRIDLERAVDLSVDVFDRVLTIAARLDPSTAPDDHSRAHEVLDFDVVAGDTTSAVLWVHNVGLESRPAPDLRCGALTSFDGTQIAASCVHVDGAPQPIDAQNSRAIEVSVDVPMGTSVGTYHGLILSSDDPDTSMRVRVRVTE